MKYHFRLGYGMEGPEIKFRQSQENFISS